MKKSITFFFPYYDVSGIPVLFLGLAEFISINYNYEVYIIDYKNGYMALNRKGKSKIKLIEFKDGVHLYTSETILVMQAILPYAIRPELLISKNTKVFFWNLYPDNFFPFVFPLNFFPKMLLNNVNFYQLILKRFYKKTFGKVKSFVSEMNDCKALIFMDSSNLKRTNEILGLELDPKFFLPISCQENCVDVKKNSSNKIGLNISWVGRICDFKVYILLYTVEKVSFLAKKLKKNIVFHIIGNGNKIDLINNLSVNNKFFKLKLVGELGKDQLDQYLINYIDINAAMGTSALESAKLGIPTVLLDVSHRKIVGDYIFRWLHNTVDFDLGHNISILDFKNDNKTLEEIITKFPKEQESLRQKSLDYVLNNHSVESVSRKFISLIDLYSIKFKNIDSAYFEKSCLRRLYEYKKFRIWSQ